MDSESHRLVHTLTAHLSLYHSHIPNPNPNPNPRPSILRWFSSLSPAHRQAALTISASSFLPILLQMQSVLLLHGPSNFLLLPDIPSSAASLPSLSSQPSLGLISRAAASNSSALLLSNSLLLFSSAPSGAAAADALTVSERLAADVDRFVGVMDGLSGGRFCCDEVDGVGLAGEWVELPWLGDMGYYSLEAFVANRLEVALRLAWIGSQGVRKGRERRVKERAAEVAGKAANLFWRVKGCFDWWAGLDFELRKGVVSAFFGKASKGLVFFV